MSTLHTLMIILIVSTTGSTSISTVNTNYKTCKKVERSYRVSLPDNVKSIDVRCIK